MQNASQPARVRCAAADMGSSTGRVIVGELLGGRISLKEVHRFDNLIHADPQTGYDCWNAEALVAGIREGLDKAEADAPLDSVGCDTWGVDFVLLDADLKPVGPWVAYRDHRTEGMIDAVLARMPAEEVYRRTGLHFQPYNSIYQLASIARREPDWLKRARHLLFSPDYFHWALSGVLSNEYTISTTSQLLNIGTRDWDPELLKLVDVSPDLLKTPVEPGTILGTTRLASGRDIKVIAPGGHDTASAVAAAPLAGPDDAFISSGTWSLMGIESETPYVGADARRFNFGNEGGVCGRYRVLKNVTGLWLIQRIRRELGSPAFAELVAEAAAVPAWSSLLNPDDPRFLNPDDMIATIRAVAAEHGERPPETPGELARAVFDSLALAYADVKAELEVLTGRPIRHLRIIGGGSQNRLLNQLAADACSVPVSAGPVETSALGNACLQMMALGAIGSLAEAREIVRRSFGVEDVQPRAAVPGAVRDRFRRIVETTPAVH